jgi:hypothetical protein
VFPLYDVRKTSAQDLSPTQTLWYGRTQGSMQQARRSQTSGGARRDRTDDLMLAKHALSQLSYGPVRHATPPSLAVQPNWRRKIGSNGLVGLGRLELPTSRLSSARSNQLSYKPEPFASRQGLLRPSAQTGKSRGVVAQDCTGSSGKKEKRRRRSPANDHRNNLSAAGGLLFQEIR